MSGSDAVEAGERPAVARSAAVRWAWFGLGWVSVGIGSLGVIVPGLPTTVFFIVAASCFARSSPRFERWVLDLPHVGPLVRDYRAGLGMPRRAKRWAIGTMLVVAAVSVAVSRQRPLVAGAIVVLIAVGVWVVAVRVPTREDVVADPPGGA
ncbi:MAG TPA: YbaN family protein [Acidimicrobiales bacterium]